MELIGSVFLTTIKNVFDERWLLMSGKRNVSVCSGHELANAV